MAKRLNGLKVKIVINSQFKADFLGNCMFGLFKNITQRTRVEIKIKKILLENFDFNLNGVDGWALSKVTDLYLNELKNYPNSKDMEEFLIYLMLLHDSDILGRYDKEIILGIVIKFIKWDESIMATDGYVAVFRVELINKINKWARDRVLR